MPHTYKGCISGKGGSQETRELQYEEQGNHKGHGQDLMKQEPGEVRGKTRETKKTRGTRKTKRITRNRGCKKYSVHK